MIVFLSVGVATGVIFPSGFLKGMTFRKRVLACLPFAFSIPRRRRFPFTLQLDRNADESYSSHQNTYSHETLLSDMAARTSRFLNLGDAAEDVEAFYRSGR